MRCREIISRHYTYRYDVCHHCSNLRHVKTRSTQLITISPSVTFPPTLHHSPLYFLQSPFLFYLSTQPLTTSPIFITPESITWLSFDYIVPSFSSLLHPWPGDTVTHSFLETSSLHHQISKFISPDSLSHYITLSHFYHHLYRIYHSFSNNHLQIIDSNFPIIDYFLQFIGSKLPTTANLPIIDVTLPTTDTFSTTDNFTLPIINTLPTIDNLPIIDSLFQLLDTL